MILKKTCKFLTFLIIISAVFIQSGCSSLNFRSEYDKGMRAYNEKKYDAAIVNFNNALNYKSDSYSTLCLLGTSYAYTKDAKMAEKTFQDAIKLFPNEWNAYVFTGDLKRSQRDYSAAVEFYETAIALESMGGKEKMYYKNLVKEIKAEETASIARNSRESVTSIADFKKSGSDMDGSGQSISSEKEIGEVELSLDSKKWEKVIEQKDDKSKVVEYGLKGEDVKNFNWTKLIAVQHFVITDNYPTTLDGYYKIHIGAIEAMAKNSEKSFENKVITQSKNNIIYEWKFDNAKESEVSRIVFTGKGLYHIHCAKKGPFTAEERAKALDLLKNAVLK